MPLTFEDEKLAQRLLRIPQNPPRDNRSSPDASMGLGIANSEDEGIE